ncbi:MAG: hypothetical protein A2Y24_07635 [Clostridiales bacterium GWE2_32_10]|nr:MAG: hypothetical protein A2Y24_07635 [Clostridiales bacterium GWE2_32_10]HBY19747.1 hypothetical protein [Clostridiales bacterium]
MFSFIKYQLAALKFKSLRNCTDPNIFFSELNTIKLIHPNIDIIKLTKKLNINLETEAIKMIDSLDTLYTSEILSIPERLSFLGVDLSKIAGKFLEKTNFPKLHILKETFEKLNINLDGEIKHFSKTLDFKNQLTNCSSFDILDFARTLKSLNLDINSVKYELTQKCPHKNILELVDELLEANVNINDISEALYTKFNSTSNGQVNKVLKKQKQLFYKNFLGIDITDRRKVLNPSFSKDIKFGVEIETVGVNKDDLTLLKLDDFEAVDDLSIKGYDKELDITKYNTPSAELVSDILNPHDETNIDNIFMACEQLNDKGARTNHTCGLHFHVSSPDIKDEQLLETLYNDVTFFQYVLIDKLNIYSNRLSSHTKPIPKIDNTYDYKQFRDLINIDNATDIDNSNGSNRNINRYYMLNLCSLNKHGTGEFRFPNLPDEIDENVLLALADLSVGMIDSIRKNGSICERVFQKYDTLDTDKDLTLSEASDWIYNEFLDQTGVTETSKIVLNNMDSIFEFYGAKEPSIPNRTTIDFYKRTSESIAVDNLPEEDFSCSL